MKKINWGIVGAGNIASSFVKALAENPDAALYALASRDKSRADSFARLYGFSKVYAGDTAYAELCADKKIDAVYIATPHTNHAELSLCALKAGKAVLCEKPAAVNAGQLQSVLDYSASHKVFYMEALWMKFNPAVRRTMEALRGGAVGHLLNIQADFCINVPYDINHRLFNPLLAGGALLDTGIYPITFAMLAASCAAAQDSFASAAKKQAGFYEGAVLPPSRFVSSMRKSPSGVDIWSTVSAEWDLPSGMLTARLSCGNDIEGRNFFNNAVLCGTKGKILLRNFWGAEEIEYYDEKNNLIKKEQYPFRVNGYEYEIEETHRCITNGLYESPLHTHAHTRAVIRTLDKIRSQWGLIYPFETPVPEHKETALIESGDLFDEEKQTEAGVKMKGVSLYSDGACSGNPGPGGWGAVILYDGKIITAQGGEKPTTNNRMELSGAIGALETLFSIPNAKNEKIVFYIDSQYVKNGITSWIHTWKKNGWRTSDKKPVKNKDLWEKLDLYTQDFKIEWRWVKGHAGNTYNELCDKIAVEERDKRA